MIFMRRVDESHNLMLNTSTDTTHVMYLNRQTGEEKSVIQIDRSTNVFHDEKCIAHIRMRRGQDTQKDLWFWATEFVDESLNGVVEPTSESNDGLYRQEAAMAAYYIKYLKHLEEKAAANDQQG